MCIWIKAVEFPLFLKDQPTVWELNLNAVRAIIGQINHKLGQAVSFAFSFNQPKANEFTSVQKAKQRHTFFYLFVKFEPNFYRFRQNICPERIFKKSPWLS